MERRRFLGLSGLFAASAAFPAANAAAAKPNIILIVSDDQGYCDLAVSGGPEIKTPNIDKLAKEGARFTRFYSASPVCGPARASLLTGRYPQRHGLSRNPAHAEYTRDAYPSSEEATIGLDLREVLLSQPLKEQGYATGMIGKWDFGRKKEFLPLQRGFDSFYGHAAAGIDYYFHTRYGMPVFFKDNEPFDEPGYSTELFERETLSFIERHRSRPFFLHLAFNAPHFPSNSSKRMQAPEEYIRMYGKRPYENRVAYMAAVTAIDKAIGAMVKKLKTLGIDRNTIIAFVSDNGGDITENSADNTPLRNGKSSLFEGGVRVPALIHWPAKIRPGTVCDRMVSMMDLFPTLVEAAGCRLPPGIPCDGVSLLPLFRGEAQEPHDRLFWNLKRVASAGYPAGETRAAIVGDWKMVQPLNAPRAHLFNLSLDPAEGHDFSQIRPEKLQELEKAYSGWQEEMTKSPGREPFEKR